jgi:hypothetical protein
MIKQLDKRRPVSGSAAKTSVAFSAKFRDKGAEHRNPQGKRIKTSKANCLDDLFKTLIFNTM